MPGWERGWSRSCYFDLVSSEKGLCIHKDMQSVII